MANKRELKKYVDALGTSVCEDMLIARYNTEGIDADAVDSCISKVLAAVAVAKNNANRFFDRGPRSFADPKEYARAHRAFFRALFDKILTDFTETISEAIKDFNAAVPAAVKEANKANA